MSFRYAHARPALAVDCVVFGLAEAELRVLLIRRDLAPYEDRWALPGGFVRIDETLEDAARRELSEESGIDELYLEQLYTFGALDRDPRERVVSVAYYALTRSSAHEIAGGTDAREAAWFALAEVPELPFDHSSILALALERLRGKLSYCPIGFELLPERFSLTQLQRLYELVLDRELDKRNFRKKVLGLGVPRDTGEQEIGVPRRPARLYRFDREAYRRLERRGVEFEL